MTLPGGVESALTHCLFHYLSTEIHLQILCIELGPFMPHS
jgi:hypothetical protein